jgi:isoleucyl-tRNA synthetase
MPAIEPVSNRVALPELEAEVLALWRREGTFTASLERRRGSPPFVFYEGPPTPNGRPGTHHVVVRAIKDLFCRHRTMEGHYVPRKAGWDTHGLPIELAIERRLGITSRRRIEELGIERFNERCRRLVDESVADWISFSERMGYWLDHEDAYRTDSSDYVQSVWWALRQLWDRGLVYRDFRLEPYCPRCGTPLSSHELELAEQVRVAGAGARLLLPVPARPGTALLAWAPEVWTLPGTAAVAVDPDAGYVRVRWREGEVIVAEARLGLLRGHAGVVGRLPGEALVGLEYEPPFGAAGGRRPVVAGRVPAGEETGLAHLAPGHDRDAFAACRRAGLPMRHAVDGAGVYPPEAGSLAGRPVDGVEDVAIADLRGRGLLHSAVRAIRPSHRCWRCGVRLLLYGHETWFISTSPHKEQLLEHNAATRWNPARFKTGRMRGWLRRNVDWAISRSRYWGTPLPFWVCAGCGYQRCVGSADELGLPAGSDLHRPFVDRVTLPCGRCGGTMRRVADVLDVWFDSACLPFAQFGYPRRRADEFRASFPADLVVEGVDHTRGAFYTALVVSSLIFGRNFYRNAVVPGHVLDDAGRKASKSKGNVLDPDVVFERFGADAVRWWFYTAAPVGRGYRLSLDAVDAVTRKLLLPLWNVFALFTAHAARRGFDPATPPPPGLPALDRWLRSRVAGAAAQSRRGLAGFDPFRAAAPYQELVNDLSNWYVRHLRRRLTRADQDPAIGAGLWALHETLVTLSRLLAPFVPFVTEAIHHRLTGTSVHLADYPHPPAALRDRALEERMAQLREMARRVNEERAAAGVRQRRPLYEVAVPLAGLDADLVELLRQEVNAWTVRAGEPELRLDLRTTPELLAEGLAREVVWRIQGERKRASLGAHELATVAYASGPRLEEAIERHRDLVLRETMAQALHRVEAGERTNSRFTIEGEQLCLSVGRSATA